MFWLPGPAPLETCTDADMERAREVILRSYGNSWRRHIERERPAIIAGSVPPRAEAVEAILSRVGVDIRFSKACTAASVTARYEWQVSWLAGETPHNRAETQVRRVTRGRRFVCGNVGGTWLCN